MQNPLTNDLKRKGQQKLNEELKIFISAEIDKLKEELIKAQKELKKTEKESKTAGQKIADGLSNAGKIAGKAMKAVATAVMAAGAALVGITEATRDYRTQQAMLATAFQTSGGSAEIAKETYDGLYRVLGDTGQATEAALHLAKLTSEQEALSEWTTICQGVYATFGASLPIESLTEAANETAKTGELTGALADALNWAGINEEEFRDKLFLCNTEAEREALIRETLSGLYGEAAASYEENAKSVLEANEAQGELTDSMAEAGAALEPVMNLFKQMLADVLTPLMPTLQGFATEHLPAVSNALAKVGEIISSVIGWIIEHWTFVSTIAIIIAGITAALTVLSTVMTVVNLVMAASPVTWIITGIVAAIAALVAIIIVCVKYWDEIKAAATKAWNAIVNAFTNAGEWFNSKVIQPIAKFFTGMWDGLKNGAKNAWEGVKNAFSSVSNWFKDTFSAAWQKVKNVFSAGGKVFDGIKDGIASTFKTVVNGLIGGINKVIAVPFNAINSALGKIKNVSVAGIEPFSWMPTISVPQIPKLYRGGVLEKGQVGLLEGSGAEAIVPLEQNTGWLNEIARRLGEMLDGGSREIILQVDGTTLARTSIKSINELTKQTGKLDLVLA